jgi:uncharacterized damage-inducible protein DinB
MDPNERQIILADLHTGRSNLIAVLSSVTEDQAARIPSPGSWSVLQCVEHLAVAEKNLFSRLSAAQPSDTSTLNPRRETLLVTRGLDRTRKRQAPEAAIPTGRFPTLSAALQHFLENRDHTILFVEQCTADLRCRQTSHPLIGVVNCHELLLLIAVHPLRHIQQIEEIKAATN